MPAGDPDQPREYRPATPPATPAVLRLVHEYRQRILASDRYKQDLAQLPLERRRERLRHIVLDYLREDRELLAAAEQERLIAEIQADMAGFGPLEPLLRDPEITEIMVNGPHEVYVERDGRVLPVPGLKWRDDDHVRQVARTMIAPTGRRLDDSSPMVDGRLPDGSRVNVIIPPLSLKGTILTIRRFRPRPWTLPDLVAAGALSAPMADYLRRCVRARLNILISGGTGSGKTSLLGALAAEIPAGERVITIEDMAELRLDRAHVIPLEARPPNAEGRGEITIRDLVRNALRMRPDRIIVGEVRGPEVLDMLQAMNTGHEDSYTTIHANSATDALARLETLVVLSGARLPVEAIREHMLPVFHVIVQTARLGDGSRRVLGIYELVRAGGRVEPHALFEYQPGAPPGTGPGGGAFRGPLRCSHWEERMGRVLASGG